MFHRQFAEPTSSVDVLELYQYCFYTDFSRPDSTVYVTRIDNCDFLSYYFVKLHSCYITFIGAYGVVFVVINSLVAGPANKSSERSKMFKIFGLRPVEAAIKSAY